MNKPNKRIKEGRILYDEFAKKIAPSTLICNPKTQTLELFAILKEKKLQELLIAEMCKEFASNFQADLIVDNGVLKIEETRWIDYLEWK